MPTAANIAAAEAMIDAGNGVDTATEPKTTGAPPTGVRNSAAVSTPVPVDEGHKDPPRRQQTLNTKRGANGKFEKALEHIAGAVETVEGKPAIAPKVDDAKKPEVAKTDAELRREKLNAQLADLRAKSEERKAKTARDTTAAQLEQRKAELEKESARVAAESAKWAAVEKDPVAGLKAMGRDVGEHFMKLSEAARTANTPEAKIVALEAMVRAQSEGFQTFQQQLAERDKAAQDAATERAQAAERSTAEAELARTVTPELYPHARAYFSDEEIVHLGHMLADRQRKEGITPSYESVAKAIEKTAAEHHATVLSKLPQSNGASRELARQAPTERAPGTAPQTPAAGTISNDLASATASGEKRRKALADRQRDAQRLLE